MIRTPVTLPRLDPTALPCLLADADRLPLLITGIAGVAGYNGFAFFRSRYGDKVTGQRPENNWPLSGPGIVGIDLEDVDGIRRLLDEGEFRTVLNCGGSCALKSCELDPIMARRVNVSGIEKLLDEMEQRPIRFVHLSIDLVYSGTGSGSHVESDQPDPVTVYGKTMVEAEQMILARRPDSCVARISLPMGVSFNGHAGAIDWIQHRFASNKPATLYFDEVRTPTYVGCLNETLERILASDLSGLFHAGGQRKLSLYQIAQIVNRVGGYNPDLLQGCPRIEAGPMPPRAGNVTMDSSQLATALGIQPFIPWPYLAEQVPTDRRWHYGRNGFCGSLELLKDTLYLRPQESQT